MRVAILVTVILTLSGCAGAAETETQPEDPLHEATIQFENGDMQPGGRIFFTIEGEGTRPSGISDQCDDQKAVLDSVFTSEELDWICGCQEYLYYEAERSDITYSDGEVTIEAGRPIETSC